jgi:uncharacterized repeat protein (TIGR02543 family)
MHCAAKLAYFRRVVRRALHHFLALVIAVSTLSAISVVTAPEASALTDANCAPSVTDFTVGSSVTAVADSNDCIITFKSGTGTWTPPSGVSLVQILVVAGGGGGGSRHAGGGGAGGVLYVTNYKVTGGSPLSLGVGTGGLGATAGGRPYVGNDSYFGSSTSAILAKGGGVGAGSGWEAGTGGSTGGNNTRTAFNATATPGSTGGTSRTSGTHQWDVNSVTATVYAYGNKGGVGLDNNNSTSCVGSTNSNTGWCGGGGGGAGAVGGVPALESSPRYRAGNGGSGVSNSITGTAVTYGGGGGGGSGGDTYYASTDACVNNSALPGSAGSGGGGAGGACATAASDGLANTGGGGGGGGLYYVTGNANSSGAGGAGGSGVVIVRFTAPTPSNPTIDLDAASDTGYSSTDNVTNDPTPTFSGTSTAGSTIQLKVGSSGSESNTGSCTSNSAGAWSCTASSQSAGTLRFIVTSTYFGSVATSSALNVTLDVSSPGSAEITRTNGSTILSSGQTANISFVPGSPLYGFTVADVTVTGGTLSSFTEVNARLFTVVFTPTANASGTASIGVPANGFTDAAGNFNTASTSLSISYNTYGTCSPTSSSPDGYTVLTFTSTSICNWSVPEGVTAVDVLVVAGGGGGGIGGPSETGYQGGGGGAGGFIENFAVTLNQSAYTIQVGTGGAPANNGVNSVALGITATGGGAGAQGGGAGGSGASGSNGGSGGGGGWQRNRGGTGVAGQGFAGATASVDDAGGGGGAGEAGNTDGSGHGGDGKQSAITGLTYAGGGTGHATNQNAPGTGVAGTGGGGTTKGSWSGNCTSTCNGTANTGGGGAGAYSLTNNSLHAGSGGSGVVVIRYASSVTVTFSANDGSGTPATRTQSITSGTATALTANNFTRTGYSFAGWNTNINGTSGTSYSDTATVTINANMTLHAKWTGNSYSVSWDSNSGSSVSSPSSFTFGSTISKPTDPTLAGKYFVGWSTTETSNQGDSGSLISSWPYTPSSGANISLYARWTDTLMVYEPFTGTNGNNMAGDTGSGSSGLTGSWILLNSKKSDSNAISGTYRTTTGITFPKNSGFTRPSNNTAASGTDWKLYNTARQLSTPISFDSSGTYYLSFINHVPTVTYSGSALAGLLSGLPLNTSDTTPWSLLFGSTYSGKFGIDYGKANQASWVAGQSRIVPSSTTYSAVSTKVSSPTTEAAANFVLVKIVTSASGNDEISLRAFTPSEELPISDSSITWDVTYATPIEGSANYMITETEFYGTIDEYRVGYSYDSVTDARASKTITFDSNYVGGATSTTQSIYSGISAALTANTFSRTGFTFAGWNTSANGTGDSYSNSGSVTFAVDTTLYAQWTGNSLTVTYDAQGGSAVASSTVSAGGSISSAPTAPTKTGYTLSGWSTSSSGSTVTFAYSHGQTANFTLYAIWAANALTVTYNSKGGSDVSNGTVNTGAAISSAPTAPTKNGYTLVGWSATDGGTVITFPYTHGQTSGFTLYAKWTVATLTVTYDSKSGTSVASGSTTTEGTISLAPTAPTKAGFTFAGWSATDGGTAITFAYTHGKTADFTLYAKWTINVYTITFVYNSATGGNSVETATVTTGLTPVTLPTPSRDGHTFDKWYAESSFVNEIGAAGATYMPTGTSLTPSVYAKWIAINYTVTYAATNSSGGSAPTDSTNYNINNKVVIKGNTGSLARTGYTFTGWTAASDGSGALLTSGGTFTVGTSNMIFTPKWSANTYTITYNKNGASGSPADATASYTTAGTAVTLSLQGTMEKTGFNWGGWSATPTGIAVSDNYTTTSNVILYAVWTIKTITLTYDKGIASSATFVSFPTSASGNYGTSITLNSTLDATVTFDVSGQAIQHRFVGWNDGSSVYQGNTIYLLGATNKIMTANWVKVFGVRYSFNGGTAAANTSATDTECLLADSLCNNLQVITTHAAPSKAGYNFAGWVNQNGTSVPTASTTTITSENYLFYATWTAVNYSITYSTVGGSLAPTETDKQMGGTFTVATAPTKAGYNFTGWNDGSTILGVGVTYYVATSNVTLTAQWSPKTYTVIYDWNGGSGSSTSNSLYTVENAALTLPVVGDHVKDGYTFSGWSETNNGSLLSGGYTPTADLTLYAIWGTGNYTTTYDAQGGTVGTTSAAVQNGSSLTLPTPTRANFVFEGWYPTTSGGAKIGNAGASHQPTQSRTLYARWTQASLYGLSPASLTRIGTTTASSSSNSTFTSSNSTSSVSVTVPSGSLPNGTTVNYDLVGDFTRAQSVLAGTNSYIISLVVSWLASDGTVPNTVTGTSIAVTITNASIRTGMSVYGIVAGAVTLLGTATQDGTVTVNLTSDPEVVVVATKPGAPTSVAASSNATQQSVVSWSAPSSDGGSVITGYTVTSNTNATCSTSTTSCTFTGLADATSYTFTVTATNALGTSAASSSASAKTAGKPDAPTSVIASANATQQSVISWTAPVSNGASAITGYTATANGGAFCTTATTSCTITGLADGTTYTFTVTATNVLGTSDPSTSSTARTASAVVNNGGGGSSSGGGGSSTPAPSVPSEPVVPSTPVKSNVTVVAPVTIVGDQDAKVIAVDIATPTPGSNAKPAEIKVDKASEKFIAGVKVVDGKLVLTPETGFSGKKTVTVTITENGADRIVQIPLTVLPEAVTKPVLTPTASNRSNIRWTESPNADGYTVYLNGKKVCTTTALSCSVKTILGPDANIEIVSNGGDRTVSQRVDAEFRQNVPVAITRLVSATITKASLTRVDTKALDQVVALIKNQGFGTVVISEITTTSKTKALAATRIESIKKYITSKIGTEEVEFEVTPVKSRTYFNNISVKG